MPESSAAGSRWPLSLAAAVLVASGVILPRAATLAQRTQQFVLQFELAAAQPTIAELFVDRGAGFDPRTSQIVHVAESAAPLPYSLPLVAGRYSSIRFDPSPGDGEWTLRRAAIVDRYGRVVVPLDLSKVRPSRSVAIKEAKADLIAGATRAGQGDPQLVYPFVRPLILWLSQRDAIVFAIEGLLVGILVASVAYLLQQLDKPLPLTAVAWGARRPGRAILVAACLSTLLSTYPLLFGRSLVTPNNGPTSFFYPSPPYTAASADVEIEDARAADVKATMLVTLPYAMAQRRAIAHGEVPWWNRYSENGVPLWGQLQSSLLDPLQWLLLSGDLALGADLKFIAARLIFTTGAGLAALGATGSFGAALVTAIAAPFLGHFIFRLNDAIHFSIVYAPWILAAYAALLRHDARRGLALATCGLMLATALLLVSSSPKEAFAMLPAIHVAGAIAIALQAWRSAEWRLALRKLALAIAAVTGAVLLAAPHWLIFVETLSNAFTAYDTSAFEFAGMRQALALVAGLFQPGMVYPASNPAVGALAALAILAPRTSLVQPLTAGCAIVAAAMLVLAFGVVPESWLAPLPLFARIHHIGSTLLTAVLPLLLVVAAAGAATLRAAGVTHNAMRVAVAIVIAFALGAMLAVTADLSDPSIGFGAAACAWTGVLCYLLPLAARQPTRFTTGVTALTGLALLLPQGLHLPTGIESVDRLLMQPRPRVSLSTPPEALRPALAPSTEPARIAGIDGVMQGGVPTYVGLEGITGADALFAPHVYWLGKQFEPEYYPLWLHSVSSRTDRMAPLLDLWGVRWLVKPRDQPANLTGSDRPAFDKRLELIERPSAWPRAFFVERIEAHGTREQFVARLRFDTRPFASIRADDAAAAGVPLVTDGGAATIVGARDYRLTANTTTFAIDASSPGIVVLNETYWPGVSARIGDRLLPVFRVNETMRGVAVPTGTWQVTFSYRPQMWNVALALTALGTAMLVALIAAAALGWRSKPERAG